MWPSPLPEHLPQNTALRGLSPARAPWRRAPALAGKGQHERL